MKERDFRRFSKDILPNLPGFAYKRGTLFETPVCHLLKGFCFEPSGDKSSFYFWVFATPLYVNPDAVSFLFGDRLKRNGSEGWDWAEEVEHQLVHQLCEVIERNGVPFLMQLSNLEELLRVGTTLHSNPRDPHVQRALAYANVLLNKGAAAISSLNELCETLKGMDHLFQWQQDLLTQVISVRELYARNPQEAINLLRGWEVESATKLGFGEFTRASPE